MDDLIRLSIGGWAVLGLRAGVGIALAMIIVDIVRGMIAVILEHLIGTDDEDGGRT